MFAKRSVQKNLRRAANSNEDGKALGSEDSDERGQGIDDERKGHATVTKDLGQHGDFVGGGSQKIPDQNKDSVDEKNKDANDEIKDDDADRENFDISKIIKALPQRQQVAKFKNIISTKTSEKRKGDSIPDLLQDFRTSKSIKGLNDNRATATFDVDTDKTMDHRAILERNDKIAQALEKGELKEGVYRGQGAYRQYVKRKEGALSNAKTTGLYGPVRGTNNVRMTMYIDYNPEICKDYKETGYCGFGDSCIYIHDRHDYKAGWQIEKEWQEQQKKEQERLTKLAAGLLSDESGEEEEQSNDGLPFACLKCRKKWTEEMTPVSTKCGHYFCEKCAFEHYKTSIKCFQCGRETQGIFNAAHDLVARIQRDKADSSA